MKQAEIYHSFTQNNVENMDDVSDTLHHAEQSIRDISFSKEKGKEKKSDYLLVPQYTHWCLAKKKLPNFLGVFEAVGTKSPTEEQTPSHSHNDYWCYGVWVREVFALSEDFLLITISGRN